MSTKEKKEDTKAPAQKRCFVITPIGTAGTDVNRAAMGLLAAVIKPVFTDRGFHTIAAHEITATGSINKQIVTELLTADFCVANLTGLNPNVMYELAIRHAAKKPLICMAARPTSLPFDIIDERTIFYVDDMADVNSTKAQLEAMTDAILEEGAGHKPDNPITRASTVFEISADVKQVGSGEAIIARLDMLERTLVKVAQAAVTDTSPVQNAVENTFIAFTKLPSDPSERQSILTKFCTLIAPGIPAAHKIRVGRFGLSITPKLSEGMQAWILAMARSQNLEITMDPFQ